MKNLSTALQQYFGHSQFREGQEKVIAALMAGRSALAIFPTGGGKSICYQLPGVLLDGLTLVVSPLIALMKDQVDMLQKRGIAAARMDSTLSAEEAGAIYQQMKDGKLKLLYVAPERLINEKFLDRLKKTRLAMMAIDEAHCISEWGHNFRPEYLRLAKVARQLKLPRILALTATATPQVADDICREFGVKPADRVQTPFHRNNLHLAITPVAAEKRPGVLASRLKNSKRLPAIVYVTLQKTAESVAAHLQRAGLNASAYHAGLADEVRAKVQEDFMTGRTEIIVATIAFGMGIDKANIRAVWHYNLPKTLENYQQEIGRAGRDGKPSHCEMLACGDDLIVLQNFTHGDTPTQNALQQVVNHLLRQGGEFEISRYELSVNFDIRPNVLETVITHLEREGLLEPTGSRYAGVQIAFNQTREQIISGHTPARQKFLNNLFDSGKQGRKWLTLDIDASAAAIGETRERIVKALGYLEESGDIVQKPGGLRHTFRLLPEAKSRKPAEVAQWLGKLFTAREQADIRRLQSVVALAEDPGCTTRHLLSYFGETMEAGCGHCDHCKNPPIEAQPLPRSKRRAITTDELAQIEALRKERHAALRAPRQLARFLCGLTSPATTRERLTKHDAFALLEDVPFEDVLAQVDL